MSNLRLLSVRGLCKHFSSPAGRIDVLNELDFELNEGEFLAIVGESGSGKSTMLQILGTLERPDAGDILLDQTPIQTLASNQQALLRNEKIGFVYQAHHLIPELTALENVVLPLLVRGVAQAEADERGRQLLSRLNLSAREEHIPARLSGGEAQRVAVARALAASPRLLLADEPTGNLDEHTAHEVFALLRQLCREENAAVVMVTHSLSLAHACDRMLTLHNGKLVAQTD